MKKCILMLALSLATLQLFAQKGQLWLGGGFSYDYQSVKLGPDTKIQSLNSDPYLEYFFANTWSVFGGVGFAYDKMDNSNSFVAGPFVGVIKYFPFTDKISLYTTLEASGAWGSAKNDAANYNASRCSMRLTPGINVLVLDRLAVFVEFGDGLKLESSTYKNKDNSSDKYTDSHFAVDLFSGIGAGVQFKLR